MFIYLFYGFGILFVMYELKTLLSPIEHLEARDAVKKGFKELKEKRKTDKSAKLNGDDTAMSCFMGLYAIWSLVGVFSSQWVLFSGLITLSFLSSLALRVKNQAFRVVIVVLDSVLTLGFLMAIILNKFHFHYNIPEWLGLSI